MKALVYVAAFQPEVGESLALLNSSTPSELPNNAVRVFGDGFYVIDPEAWIAYVANRVPETDARYTAVFQTPASTSIFAFKAEAAAWRKLPSWSVVATRDRTIGPELQWKMSEHSRAKVTAVEGGYLVQISHPDEVVAVIEDAAARATATVR